MLSRRIFLYMVYIGLASQMIFFTGCHNGRLVSPLTDSTEIKKIEEMQERGTEYRNNSVFDSAIAIHDSCVQMAENIHDTIQLIVALNNQGTDFRRLSANKEASDCHFRALQICEAYSDSTSPVTKKNLCRSLNGLGNVMLTLGNYDAAEQAFRRALAGEQSLNNTTGQAINYANLGSIKEYTGKKDSARIYYNLSMEKNHECNNSVGISLCYNYLGNLDRNAGHTADALSNFRLAYAVGSTTKDTWHVLVPCISLAELYVDQNQIDSASKYINIGIESAKKIHSNEHLRDLYGVLSRLDEKRGNIPQALADLKLYTSYNDSVASEDARNSVQNARVNYESNRRSIEVRAAENSAQSSRLIRDVVIIAAILIVGLMLIAFWLYRHSLMVRHKSERDREIFVRNVTHQLRTPMTVVTGMVEQLKDHIPADDAVGMRDLEATKRQSRKLQELIMQLARMSKTGMAPLLSKQGDISQTVLPEVPADTNASGTPKETPSLPSDPDRPSILLAEDTDDVAMMMCSLLQENGYIVTRAADGQEALDMLQHELPDLLITDIAMPRMDGLELMRRIRNDEIMCHLPIIVASARVEDSERMEGISAGAEVYLTKPFIPEELLLRISTMLKQRERLRRSFSHVSLASTDNGTADKEKKADNVVNEEKTEDPKNVKKEEEKLEKPQMTESERAFIEALNTCIDNNMSADVSNTFIATNLSTSASTINRRIKNITGMTVAAYIRTRRIIYAKQMLAKTDKSIAEIESLCGFSTPGHFSRVFKAETGVTPSEFRHSSQEA